MIVITVANLKGGSAKTTTSAYLAHALEAAGQSVVLVDADPQGSSLRWSELAEWELPTVALPVKNLHARLRGIVPPDTDIVVIDTPPLDDQAGIVYSALRVADVVIVTMAPTMMEFERLADVWDAIDQTEPLRAEPAKVAVLLNRVNAQAKSTSVFRHQLEDEGRHVISTAIPRREAFAQAFGAPITDLGAYEDAAAEIAEMIR